MYTLSEIEESLSSAALIEKQHGCMFCEPEPGLVVEETEHLVLIRDKFPVVEGHLMIVSKMHFGCMGELPAEFFSEVEHLRYRCRAIFGSRRFIGYEHGRAGHCVKLKGSEVTCHHFHLHYLPLSIDIRDRLKSRFCAHRLVGLSDVKTNFERLGEYLYFETIEREGFFYPADSRIESHLLRTLVCEESGHASRADWEVL